MFIPDTTKYSISMLYSNSNNKKYNTRSRTNNTIYVNSDSSKESITAYHYMIEEKTPICPVCLSTDIKRSKNGTGDYQTYCSKTCATYARNKSRSKNYYDRQLFLESVNDEISSRNLPELPFECSCGKKFSRLCNLERHRKSSDHKKKLPFNSNGCDLQPTGRKGFF